MNVYEISFGHLKHFVAAESEEDAYSQGTDPETFPDLHFRPFEVRQVEVEGYTITVTQEAGVEAPKRRKRA